VVRARLVLERGRPVGPNTPIGMSGFTGRGPAPRRPKLGIKAVRDLLFHLPRRYDDCAN